MIGTPADYRDRTMRIFRDFGCCRTDQSAGVAIDPDGADADHLGDGGIGNENGGRLPTLNLGFNLQRVFRSL